MIKSSWAILRCKFNDDDSEPFPTDYYQDLFTSSGNGSQNMVDFFRDVSHGTLDLGIRGSSAGTPSIRAVAITARPERKCWPTGQI